MRKRLTPSQRVETHNKRVFVRVWTKRNEWPNKYFNYDPWEIIEEWFVFFGFNPKIHGWFNRENSYYDGHTLECITICGLVFGKGYTYQSQSLKEE